MVVRFLLFGFVALFTAVDINDSTKKDLQSVKGIDSKKTQRIVVYIKSQIQVM